MKKKWWYSYRCPDCQRLWSNTGQLDDPPLIEKDGEIIGYALPQTKRCETCIEWASACEAALASGELPPPNRDAGMDRVGCCRESMGHHSKCPSFSHIRLLVRLQYRPAFGAIL